MQKNLQDAPVFSFFIILKQQRVHAGLSFRQISRNSSLHLVITLASLLQTDTSCKSLESWFFPLVLRLEDLAVACLHEW